MKRIGIIVFFISISISAFPNHFKLFPGYYVGKTGDTIRCNIEFNDWNNNPGTIHVQVNGTEVNMGPGDIKGFGIYGYVEYKSATVTYHLNPIDDPGIPLDFSDSTVTKTCFLKINQQAPYSLYSLVLTERVYFFISSADQELTELLYRAKEDNGVVSLDETYKKQLFSLFNKEGITNTYFNRINSASYNGQQIGLLINILNENRSGVHIKKNSNGVFSGGLFIGGIQNSFPTSFNGVYSHDNKLNPSYSFTGGINFLFSIPGNFKSFRIGLDIGYNSYKYHVTKSGVHTYHSSDADYGSVNYTETYEMAKSVIVFQPYIMYVMNPLSKINAYVKAGFNYNLSVSSDPDMTVSFNDTTTGIRNGNVPVYSTYGNAYSLITIKESFLSVVGSVGVISGKSRLEFSYSPPANLATITGDITAPHVQTFKIGTLGLYYYYSFL